MRETKIKNRNSGITLIALVITIIVMLILVAVTINMAVNGGLFDKAGEAVGKTQDAIDREKDLGNGKIQIGETVYNSIDEYLNEGKKGTSLVEMFKKGELQVGDYVDYKPTTPVAAVDPDAITTAKAETKTGSYEVVKLSMNDGIQVAVGLPEDDSANGGALTGWNEAQSVAQETSLKWRVLGLDEAKNELLLISATPTTARNYTVGFYGHVGYNNYETVLKNVVGKLYGNSELGATARSINMNDIDTYLGGSAYDKTTFGGGSSTSGGYGYQNPTEWTNVNTPTKWGGVDKGTATVEAGELTSNAYYYKASDYITDAKKLEMLIGTQTQCPAGPYYYWVASRAVYVGSVYANWCVDDVSEGSVNANINLCYSNGYENENALSLRPVVSLSSKVTTEQVPVIKTAPTLSWNDPLGLYGSES